MEERRGGGYDHERGSMAPEDGTWRSRAPPPRQGGGGFDRDGGGGGSRMGGGGFDRDGGGGSRMGGGGFDRDGGGGGSRMGGGGFGDRDGGGRMGGGGGGFDERRSGPGRDGGYDNPPSSGGPGRVPLKLQSRTLALPEPTVPAAAAKPVPAPAEKPKPKPSGPRSNPFGAASAVDTTQRDLEIEAKAEAARQGVLRRRDETIRSSKPASAAVDNARAGDGEGGEGGDTAAEQSEATEGAEGDGGEGSPTAEVGRDGDGDVRKGEAADGGSPPTPAPKSEPVKPVGRWAALRREGGGGEDRAPPAQRRDRDDDRRGGGGGFDGRGGGGRDERSSFGRRNDGDSAGGSGGGFGGGSRIEREPFQPPAPPAGNAFAKRFGSNERETDRSFPRPRAGGMGGGGGFERNNDDRRGGGMGGGMGMGGGNDRWDDDRRGSGGSGGGYDRGGGGGYDRTDRRDDGRGLGGGGGGGGGMPMGGSRFRREDEGDSQRRYGAGSSEGRPALNIRPAGGGSAGATSSPPSSLSKMSMKGGNEAAPVEAEVAAAPEPEPEVEPTPEPEPEPEEPKEDPVEVARLSAAEALASGKRGVELKEFVMKQEKRTTAGALLTAALEGNDSPQDMKWSEKGEFGPALTELSQGSTQQQMGMIYAVVAKCNAMGFPKVAGASVVQAMFMGMYNGDLCEEEAFIEWKVGVFCFFVQEE